MSEAIAAPQHTPISYQGVHKNKFVFIFYNARM